MSDINSVFLEGNLTRDAELREPKKGFKVAEMALALNEYYTKWTGEEIHSVSFVRVRSYGKVAELCAEKGKRGERMRLKGKLKQDRWIDKESGSERHRLFVEALEVKFKVAEKHDADEQNSEEERRQKEAYQEMIDVNLASLSQIEEMEKLKDSVENSGK